MISEERRSDSLPSFFEHAVNIQAENSVFNYVNHFLTEHPDLESICVCTGYIPEWNDEKWKAFMKLQKSSSSSVHYFEDCDTREEIAFKPYLSAFDAKDLRMALDQNYRPNFEDLSAAFSTFGFPVSIFTAVGKE